VKIQGVVVADAFLRPFSREVKEAMRVRTSPAIVHPGRNSLQEKIEYSSLRCNVVWPPSVIESCAFLAYFFGAGGAGKKLMVKV
jgi:hypothetical protein